MRTFSVVALAWLSAGAAVVAEDLDRDGVPDALEQRLIEQFAPRFWVARDDCAGRPGELLSGSLAPRVAERNGTLYAQVFPSSALGEERPALELRYFHLWDRDCGPLSPHPLDVEHVSALLIEAPDGWTALHWYAAAHEDTVCDTSNAGRAASLRAVASGPDVWVSAGKHASFLARELCHERGCGVDRCEDSVALRPPAILNLGERGRPLNGADWMASSEWPLDAKLGADFTPALVAALEAGAEPVLARVHGAGRPVQFSLSVGGDVIEGLDTGARHGGGAVAVAEDQTGGALASAFRAVGRALARTARALGLADEGR